MAWQSWTDKLAMVGHKVSEVAPGVNMTPVELCPGSKILFSANDIVWAAYAVINIFEVSPELRKSLYHQIVYFVRHTGMHQVV